MFLCFAPWRWVVIWVLEFTVKPQGSQYSPSLSEPFVDEKGNVPFSVAAKEQVPSCCWLSDALHSVADTLNSVLLCPMLCNFCLCFWPWKCCTACVSELNNFWQMLHCKLTLPSCLGCSVGGVTGGGLGVTWGRMGALLVTSCPLEFWNSVLNFSTLLTLFRWTFPCLCCRAWLTEFISTLQISQNNSRPHSQAGHCL